MFVAGAVVGLIAGPGPAMLSEMFPTTVRYTGLGLAYSLSNAVFSGSAGLIITALIAAHRRRRHPRLLRDGRPAWSAPSPCSPCAATTTAAPCAD